jgi:hypothetical protein
MVCARGEVIQVRGAKPMWKIIFEPAPGGDNETKVQSLRPGSLRQHAQAAVTPGQETACR